MPNLDRFMSRLGNTSEEEDDRAKRREELRQLAQNAENSKSATWASDVAAYKRMVEQNYIKPGEGYQPKQNAQSVYNNLKQEYENKPSKVNTGNAVMDFAANKVIENQVKKAQTPKVDEDGNILTTAAGYSTNKMKDYSLNDEQKKALDEYVTAKKKADSLSMAGVGGVSDALVNEFNKASVEAEEARANLVKLGVSEDDAKKLVQYQSAISNKEEYDKKAEDYKNTSGANKVASWVSNVLVEPVSGVMSALGNVNKLGYADKDMPVDTYSPNNELKNFQTMVGNTVQSDIDDMNASDFAKGALKFGYGVADSTSKAGISMLLGGEIVNALGLEGKAAKAVGNLVTLPQFGLSSYSTTLQEGQERGLSEKQAQTTAMAAGAFEMLTEVVSLDYFWDIAKNQGKAATRSALKNFFVQAGIEGSEEGINDVLNLMADMFINGDESQFVQTAKEEGTKAAVTQFATDLALDTAAGAISGGIFAGVGLNANVKAGKSVNVDNASDIAEAIKTDEADYTNEAGEVDTAALEGAKQTKADVEAAKTKLENGEKLSLSEKANLGMNLSETQMKEVVSVPDEFKNSVEGFNSADEAFESVMKAGTVNELADSYIKYNASSDAVKELDFNPIIQAKLKSMGATETELDAAVNRIGTEEAYRAGYRNESLEIDDNDVKLARAYNAGKLDKMYQQSSVKADNIEKSKALLDDGSEVTVTGVEDGKLVTDSGLKSLEEVSFANKANEYIYKKALELNPVDAAVYVSNYNGAVAGQVYNDIYFKTTLAARTGAMSFDEFLKSRSGKIALKFVPKKSLQAIYDAGQTKNSKEVGHNEKKATKVAKKGTGKVTVADGIDNSHPFVALANKFAKKSGFDIVITNDAKGYNGKFENLTTIFVNANSNDTFTAAIHEAFGEVSEAWNSEEMKLFQNDLLSWYIDKCSGEDLAKYIGKYQETYQKVQDKTFRQAADEMINDALGELFKSENGLNELNSWLDENVSADEKKTVLDAFKDFLDKLITAVKNITTKNPQQQVMSKYMSEKKISELRNRLLAIESKAIENYQAAEEDASVKNTTNFSLYFDNSEVTLNEYINAGKKKHIHKLNAVRDGKQLLIHDAKELETVVHKMITAKNPELMEIMAYGKVDEGLINDVRIMSNNRFNIEGDYLELVPSDINHGFSEHEKAKEPGDMDMSEDEFIEALKNINNAEVVDVVVPNKEGGKSKIILAYPLEDGYIKMIEIISTKRQSIAPKTLWKITPEKYEKEYGGIKKAERISRGIRATEVKPLSRTDASANNNISSSITENNYSLSVDSEGKKLTLAQQEFFKDSKVVDENGALKVMYHGSHNDFGFTVFDGSMSDDGQSIFFTDKKDIAMSYASSNEQYKNPDRYTVNDLQKMLGSSMFTKIEEKDGKYQINEYTYGPRFIRTEFEGTFDELKDYVIEMYSQNDRGYYEVYLNLTNPLIVDADFSNWDELPDPKDPIGYTQAWTTRDYSEYAKVNGYDGVIFENIYDSPDFEVDAQTVVIAFDSNQIKSVDNQNPTEDEDIRYSLSIDSEGNELSESQKTYFANSKVVDENGNLLRVYHGTNEEFNVFKSNDFIKEQNGLSRIKGYFSEDAEYAKSYGDVKAYYLNITNPLVLDGEAKTIDEWKNYFESKGIKNVVFDSSVTGENGTKDPTKGGWFEEGEFFFFYELLDMSNYWTGDGNLTELISGAGYDGIKSNDAIEKAWMPFDSNQIKLTSNLNPTENDDIRYSIDVDSEGNELSEGQKEYFKNSKAVDEDGALLRMYHGTVSDFTVFDRSYGNVEGDWGKGFYFTNHEWDADDNYGSESGADLTQKIERLAERLEWDEEFEDAEYEDRLAEAKKRLIQSDPKTMSVYLNITNPVYVRDNNPTYLLADFMDEVNYDDYGEDNEDEYYQAIDDLMVEKLDGLTDYLADEGYTIDDEFGMSLFQAAEEGGIPLQGLKEIINEFMPEDEEGNLSGNEIARLIAEYLGYDGIIDSTVSSKFKGMNLDEDTVHIIAFNPNQIKSSDNLNPTEDEDIRYSLSVSLDGEQVSRYSLATWTPEESEKVAKNLVATGYDDTRVKKWIRNMNTIAATIADDRERLDFIAADNQKFVKDNQEYIKTVDASTLCDKRRLYQGTFDAIQHALPNRFLTSDELIDLRNVMAEKGYKSPCGVCYVESRRRHLGKFANEWLENYNGEYKPNLDEVTTSDGLEELRHTHPQTYDDFINAMNKKGSSNPKVVELRTEYRGEIKKFTDSIIKKLNYMGGLRLQSFSDFETPHLLDMMQVISDAAAKGLKSQAYTKVPNFAWVFGGTGVKINLSLIADGDGFDSNGNLAFSSSEGMDFDEAMRIRDNYSDNVGTIIVGISEDHIKACMADDRIDFIIPFHRSGWSMSDINSMGIGKYTDFSYGQNEHDLSAPTKVVNGQQQYKGVKDGNLYPIDYWDYSLTGKENAEKYLDICARQGREPKFAAFLDNNGDGTYSLKKDGSTDGYWKLLIDFKMYNNDGVGVPQKEVVPEFNMEEAQRVLHEYEGGANKLPVAQDVVKEFVEKLGGTSYSLYVNSSSADKLIDDMLASDQLAKAAEIFKGSPADKAVLDKLANRLITKEKSRYSAEKYSHDLEKLFDYLGSEKPSVEEFERLLTAATLPVIEDSYETDKEALSQYKEFRNYIKGIKIALNDEQKAEIRHTTDGSYEAFRKSAFGLINLSDEGININDLWSEITEQARMHGIMGLEDITSDVDQVIALVDAMRGFKNAALEGDKAYDKATAEEVAHSVAMDLVADYLKQSGKTNANVYASEIRKQVAAYKKSVEAAYDAKVKELEEAYGIKNEKLANAVAKNKTSQLQKVNDESAAAYRTSIKRNAGLLFKMVAEPTDKRHVPDVLRKPTAEFLNAIDFVSHRAKEGSVESEKWAVKMSRLANVLDAIVKGDSKDEVANGLGIGFDVDLIEEMKSFVADNGEKVQLSRLNANQLKRLNKIIVGLKTQINNANALYQNRQYEDIKSLAEGTFEETRNIKQKAVKGKYDNAIRNFFRLEMVDSVSYFEVLGKSAKSVYQELRDGFNVKVKRIRETQLWFEDMLKTLGVSDKEVKEWADPKSAKVYEFNEGNLKLNPAQIMELYAHSKRKASVDHYQIGGIVATALEGDYNQQVKPVHLTEGEEERLLDTLTAKQKAVLEQMQHYLSHDCSDWGNNVTKKAYGYSKFTEENYWPIKTKKSTNQAKDNSVENANVSMTAVVNSSFTKELKPNANNAMMLNDCFSTFADHVAQMATYEGMALPIMDAMKWFNFRESSTGTTEAGTRRYDAIVRDCIANVYGKNGEAWFTKFMQDLNGTTKQQGVVELLSAFTSNFKAAAVSANARVVVQQPTAILRALNEMDGKYIFGAIPSVKEANKLAEKAQDNSAIAQWKAWGYFDTFLGQSMKKVITHQSTVKETIQEYATVGAQKADDLTWGVLYKAVELEVADKTNHKPGSKAFDEAVVKRFDEIIDRTQVVDSVFHRSQMMRTKSMDMLTAFMMEPSKSYNMVYRAICTGDKKKVQKALMVWLLNALAVSAAAAIIDGFRKDDDDTPYATRYMNAFVDNMADNANPISQIPVFKEIMSAIQGYDPTRMDIAFIYDTVSAIQDVPKFVKGESKKSGYGIASSLAKAFSELSGIPVYSAQRELVTIYNNVGNVFDLNNLSTSKSKGSNAMFNAIDSGEDIRSTTKELFEKNVATKVKDGTAEAEARKSVASSMKSSITSKYKEEMIKLYAEDKTKAIELKKKLVEAYVSLGDTNKEANEKINKWLE